ncbi:MAG: hypothetical protein II878_02380 [Bacteroidales bacterium]|nr:hypothetical protein [Bacteroidales bacterium]
MKRYSLLIALMLLFNCSTFASRTTDKDEEEFLKEAAIEVNETLFGKTFDEYIVYIGAEFVHNDSENRFTYFYILDPDIYSNIDSEAKQVIRNTTKDNLRNIVNSSDVENANDMFYLLSNLIENKTELAYSYCEKRECFILVFSVEELKEIFVGN